MKKKKLLPPLLLRCICGRLWNILHGQSTSTSLMAGTLGWEWSVGCEFTCQFTGSKNATLYILYGHGPTSMYENTKTYRNYSTHCSWSIQGFGSSWFEPPGDWDRQPSLLMLWSWGYGLYIYIYICVCVCVFTWGSWRFALLVFGVAVKSTPFLEFEKDNTWKCMWEGM